MIDIAKLTKKDIGRWVIYTSFNKEEIGRLKGWNMKNIFVVYKCAGDWDNFMNYTGCATDPKDLSFKT